MFTRKKSHVLGGILQALARCFNGHISAPGPSEGDRMRGQASIQQRVYTNEEKAAMYREAFDLLERANKLLIAARTAQKGRDD
jgi:hypothetical protein